MAEKELAEKVRDDVICEEWQRAGGYLGSLESAVIYDRLLAEEVEVADYQMSAVRLPFSYFRLDLISGTQANRMVQSSNVFKSFRPQISAFLSAAAKRGIAAERVTVNLKQRTLQRITVEEAVVVMCGTITWDRRCCRY